MQVDEIVARALCRSKQKWGDTDAVTEQYVDVCWRDYLPDARVAIAAYLSARSAEPVAWMHVMTYETGETNELLSFDDENPFGRPGRDYSAEYPVEAIPLYAHPTPEASDV